MALAPFFGTSHVEDLNVVTVRQFAEASRVELRNLLQVLVMGFPLLDYIAVKTPTDTRQANLAEVVENRLHCFLAVGLGDQVQIAVLGHERAHPVEERLPEGNVQRAGHVSAGELLRRAAVDNSCFPGE